ncbi:MULTISPECIES: bifunctional UDP-N-acetylglucosamine diphosphorylase/glucosamine-1-phosphate N-acetyltransferase GlmU [Leptolyngbya]|uniref:bifunctional UDP-N-acetylglucosamine diphosphorylase/glucosamine-1-phosphate N-acetyltransferase GlmU n=1 Tax=Leptolyngbya TaxID=47251 RepID=UPI001682B0CA|nr:bifunctional UDP-N-acetylglucosamine diphosphorylase/glucosamine-1-phosphate N-acetyltransferase GlmU [Leptolyngbya sp. FACHB-1624]MBD1857770.1 bifunctional UDP-N-acetylglucosamine diphosphorylase/glucosamine-1-phosphate N-acetyltransferase GlmU [Leptolyngbya sp. FACHB-1624]
MVAVAILAAGRGTRMKSDLPKVLHQLGSRSLVERVLGSTTAIAPSRRLVIVGYQADSVREALADYPDAIEFVDQTEQLGTGHAIQQLIPSLENFDDDLIVLNGDLPLLRPETLSLLLETHRAKGNPATLLAAHVPDPTGYGRVFCDENQILTEIVEDRDCTPEQRLNDRMNAGAYCFRWKDLVQVLPKLNSNNEQKEYYITDAINFFDAVTVVDVPDYQEVLGINDRAQLADAYAILQKRIRDRWMREGVTIIDPNSVTIDDTVELEANVTIEPQTHLRGKTTIKTGSRIGPGSLIEDSQIGENVTVLFSVVAGSVIHSNSQIGPYSHLRAPVEIGQGCRVGNFVELKNTKLGEKTNAAHLSYLGNATIGNRVNIGAGTITVNYDGVKKYPTTIGDRTKIGSNNCLVAPITIGEDVTTAAGSTITEDLPNDCLAIARARQVVKPGWKRKDK